MHIIRLCAGLVRGAGVEPASHKAWAPKTHVSANSTTRAAIGLKHTKNKPRSQKNQPGPALKLAAAGFKINLDKRIDNRSGINYYRSLKKRFNIKLTSDYEKPTAAQVKIQHLAGNVARHL